MDNTILPPYIRRVISGICLNAAANFLFATSITQNPFLKLNNILLMFILTYVTIILEKENDNEL
jgi:hypothetical protein